MACTGIHEPLHALKAIKNMGLNIVQVSNLDSYWYTPDDAQKFKRILETLGLEAPYTVIVHEGEVYKNWKTVRETVGYFPPETLQKRIEHSYHIIDFASTIGSSIVTTHMGVLPEKL